MDDPTDPLNAFASTDSAPVSQRVLVKCAGVSKTFRDFWLRNRVRAVEGLDLEIHRGEVFGLLGPNGSGKSTTIKMILGLLNPTEGRIAVLGRPPSDVSIKQRIGYLPEESYLYRFLSPRETLDYYGKLFHQDRAQRRKRIDNLLEMVGLTHAAHRPVGEFSKGMQRKVGLAQALINDPDLLILDEPTSGMDPIATAEVKDVITQLKARGKTILLCSHLLADVQDVCDRVVVMYGGKIREQGDLADLLAVDGRTVLETGQLSDEAIAEVEAVLEKHGTSLHHAARPTRKLDALFLDIVQRAIADGVQTAGAAHGGRIAAFLAEGDDAPDPTDDAASDDLLNQLTAVEPETPETPDPQEAEASSIAQDRPAEDAVLAELTGASAAEAPPVPPADGRGTPAASDGDGDKEADRDLLDSLLGDPPPRPRDD